MAKLTLDSTDLRMPISKDQTSIIAKLLIHIVLYIPDNVQYIIRFSVKFIFFAQW